MTLFFADFVVEAPVLFVAWQTVAVDTLVVVFDVLVVVVDVLVAEQESSNFPVLSPTPVEPVLVFVFPHLPIASVSVAPEASLVDVDAPSTSTVSGAPALFSAAPTFASASALEVVFAVLETTSFDLPSVVAEALLATAHEAVFETAFVLLQL